MTAMTSSQLAVRIAAGAAMDSVDREAEGSSHPERGASLVLTPTATTRLDRPHQAEGLAGRIGVDAPVRAGAV
jgi:hypothetical protein